MKDHLSVISNWANLVASCVIHLWHAVLTSFLHLRSVRVKEKLCPWKYRKVHTNHWSMSWVLREQTAFWDCTTATNATDPQFTESIPIYNLTNQLFCSSFLELELGIQPPLKREITSNDLPVQILPASNCRVWPLWQVVWLFSFKKAFFVLLFVATPLYSASKHNFCKSTVAFHQKLLYTEVLLFCKFFCVIIGPRSDHSLPMSVTHWLTHSLTDWRTCWRFNELAFVDGIKYLSDVDIEISCQQLVTSGKACKAGNSWNSCQSWRMSVTNSLTPV